MKHSVAIGMLADYRKNNPKIGLLIVDGKIHSARHGYLLTCEDDEWAKKLVLGAGYEARPLKRGDDVEYFDPAN